METMHYAALRFYSTEDNVGRVPQPLPVQLDSPAFRENAGYSVRQSKRPRSDGSLASITDNGVISFLSDARDETPVQY
jgi:hypothetical protein